MDDTNRQQIASEWVHIYSDMLYSYALRRVRDKQTAKDIVQETFLSAWRNFESYNGQASVKTWLFAILKNKLIDYYRKASTRFETEQFPGNEGSPDFFDQEDHWAAGFYPQQWNQSANNRIESSEFYNILTGCRSKLKEIQDAVFSLKYLEGLESADICTILEITTSNYWVLIHRAKLQLRACLEKNWFVK